MYFSPPQVPPLSFGADGLRRSWLARHAAASHHDGIPTDCWAFAVGVWTSELVQKYVDGIFPDRNARKRSRSGVLSSAPPSATHARPRSTPATSEHVVGISPHSEAPPTTSSVYGPGHRKSVQRHRDIETLVENALIRLQNLRPRVRNLIARDLHTRCCTRKSCRRPRRTS